MKQRKVRRYRGATTHGGGSMKKRRGAGHRGGRGFAGSGKRGDQKKPSLWATRLRKGKSGFHSLKAKRAVLKTINCSDLQRRLEVFVASGKAQRSGDAFVVDLSSIGYAKLLGAGALTAKVQLSGACTPRAAEKIKAAGGSIKE